MSRILVLVAIIAAPHLLNDALHATGIKKALWIAGGVVALCLFVVAVVEGVRVTRSQKREMPAARSSEPASISSLPYGDEIASAVADTLDAGHELGYVHPYYCGMGLTKYEEIYIYASVQDGDVISPVWGQAFYDNIDRGGGNIFHSRTGFVEWLAAQSDSSLHGDGNQSVTLKRLQSFVEVNR